MYFPILSGRQFELIALRELVENSLMSDKVIPIIEPVKLSSTLIKTIEVFRDNNKKLGLIRNPLVGNLKTDWDKENLQKQKDQLTELLSLDTTIFVLCINAKSNQFVEKQLKKGLNVKEIISICNSKDNIPIYEGLFSEEKPRFNLIPDESIFRRRIRENRVILDDKFVKQSRNTDYADKDDEPFSDDHLFYKDDGYVGFSDYSVVGDEYNETGFAPYAVVIHIVYFDKDKSLRIKHFVSDTNDDISDPAGKFAEAVGKLVEWNKLAKLNTYGIKSFTQMYQDEMYPGLGTVKKLSIMHHIELMSTYLDGVIK